MNKQDILNSYDQFILNTYLKQPLIFVKGKGMQLTDIDGKKYLDFFPGWGVANVGHCHPKVMAAVRNQIGKLIHIPNTFYHPQQAKLAKEIIRTSFPGKVFYCNSGAEACETAIKFARAYGQGKRYEIITMERSFHGRTLGALTATGQSKYHEGFAPLPDGFKYVPFNNFDAIVKAVSDKTVAIMLELVQGEGGVHVADPEYIRKLRQFCDEQKLLLIFDEVQTGMGRTGTMFAFKHYNVIPDVMILAKALGGGLPIGAAIVKKELADTFKPGMHAATFGGSPLVCNAALGVFKALQQNHGKMLKNCRDMGCYAIEKLTQLKEKFHCICEVRGLGLMIGIELNVEGKDIFTECLKRGLIINCTQGNVLRIMPALTVTRRQIDEAIKIIEAAMTVVTR